MDIFQELREAMDMMMTETKEMTAIIPYISTAIDNLEGDVNKFALAIHKLFRLINSKPHLLEGRSGEVLQMFFDKMRYKLYGLGPDVGLEISSNCTPLLETETAPISCYREASLFVTGLKNCASMKELVAHIFYIP
jgi:hypothetical protein